ncbi:MAG: hypothetical protein MJZ20_01700, partial [Bacteroidaceae bacterium]|nr:hypothetical protein [Bacteroidaceae bacterium]
SAFGSLKIRFVENSVPALFDSSRRGVSASFAGTIELLKSLLQTGLNNYFYNSISPICDVR